MPGELNIEDYSDDAKAVAGSWFGYMGIQCELRFGLRELKPTARAQVALDELVAAAVLKIERDGPHAIVYRPLVICMPFARWLMANESSDSASFKLVEPISRQESNNAQ